MGKGKKHFVHIIMIAVLIFTMNMPVQAAPAINNLYVWVHGNLAGELGTYYISFMNGDTSIQADRGDSIRLRFPNGTLLSKHSLATGTVKINNVAIDSNQLEVDTQNHAITIMLPFDIGANEYTLIEVSASAGVYNPIVAGQYSLAVDVNYDSTTLSYMSNTYSIIGSQISKLNFTTENTGTNQSSNYTITFNGNVVENDTIYVHFPSKYYYSSTDFTRFVKVNDQAVKKVEVTKVFQGTEREGTLLAITVPAGVSTFNNKEVKVSIAATNNLRNPAVEGDYAVYVYTSRDVAPVASNKVEIRNQISNVSVQVTPATVRSNSEYRLQFKTIGEIPAGTGYIEILFPSDTVIPSVISNGHILIKNSLPKKVERDANQSRLLRIYLPDNLSIAANETVSLVLSSNTKIQNPSYNGSYSMQVRTSTDRSYAKTPSYTLTGGSSNSPSPSPAPTQPGSGIGQGTSMGIEISSKAPSTTSKYTISFRTSSTGALKGGEDEVRIIFLPGVQLPEYISREHIRINNVALDTGMIKVEQNMISFRIPSRVNVLANSTFVITIAEEANIRHPSVAGDYSLIVMTTKDTAAAYSYKIEGQAAYDFYVTPVYDGTRQISTFNMTLINNQYATLTGGTDWIELTLPVYITDAKMLEKISVSVNGQAISTNRIEYLQDKITFFIPKDVTVPAKKELLIVVQDPEHLLSKTYSGTVTFKIKTSKDTFAIASNAVAIYGSPSANTPTPTPIPNQPGTGNNNTTVPQSPSGTEIKLFLGKKETYINNQRSIDLLEAPYISPKKSGVTMVPVRFISESIGAIVDYKADGQKITITYGNKYLVLTIGSDVVLKQGGGERLPVPVEAKANGITFIPIRFIAEWLGFDVSYNASDQSITLKK